MYISYITVVLVIIVTVVVSRKRSRNNQERLIHDDSGDSWDEKRHYTYDIKKAADDYTNKLSKENNIDEEFAQGAVVNPMYAPEGEVHDNPHLFGKLRIITDCNRFIWMYFTESKLINRCYCFLPFAVILPLILLLFNCHACILWLYI